MARLNRIRAIDARQPGDRRSRPAACCRRVQEAAAAARGLLFRAQPGRRRQLHDRRQPRRPTPAARRCCATATRGELCLGLEVVTDRWPQVWNGLSGLRKDNTGYDLRDLVHRQPRARWRIITAATLGAAPAVRRRVMTALAALPTLAAAVELLAARAGAPRPGADRLRRRMNAVLARISCGSHYAAARASRLPPSPWTVLLEQSDTEGEAACDRPLFEGAAG